ncbi:unnamed protein product [Cyclocybe aegerita]|uniref:Uncharacterized protein n=1 Tax=Cyclocybe aegerita TaxID=1973307 RepID=A0A8S0X383_CYCAE|nr:unnamed protein product [Cyclocybe aegerita]
MGAAEVNTVAIAAPGVRANAVRETHAHGRALACPACSINAAEQRAGEKDAIMEFNDALAAHSRVDSHPTATRQKYKCRAVVSLARRKRPPKEVFPKYTIPQNA